MAVTKTQAGIVPAATILASNDVTVDKAPARTTVTGVTYTPNAAITGAASPASRTVKIVNTGQDGSGTTVVAQLDFLSGVNGVKNDEKPLTLHATVANRDVAAGDILTWTSVPVGGTGLVDPGGRVDITYGKARTEDAVNTSVVAPANASTYGYVGKRPNQVHPDSAYTLQNGPDAPTGANGPE